MKKLITTTTLSMVALLGMALPVFADTSEEVPANLNIISGELSLETSPIESFGDITLKSSVETYHTSFEKEFNVKDLRGTQKGWRVDVSATQFSILEPVSGFSEGTESYSLPKGTLSLVPLQSINHVGDGSGSVPASSLSQKTIIDDGVVTVAKAAKGTGMGEFNLLFPEDALSIVIDPETAKVDSVNYSSDKTPYTATLTWDLVSAP